MHESTPCGLLGEPCGQACPMTAAAGPILLQEAVRRFEREAAHGEVDTGRYRLRYYTWGSSGPPLVFIHGVADTSRSFLLPISRLSAHFRCVAYDLPNGHDDGARLGRYRHEDLADDLWALLDHLGLPRAYVLGSSFGSTVALRALRQRPERLPRAVLQGGLAHRPLRRMARFLGWVLRRCPGPTARLPRRERLLEKVHKGPFAGRPDEVWRAYVDWTGRARLAALGHQVRWLAGLDLRAELARIRQPVLLVHGELDSAVPRAHADLLLEELPCAQLAVLEGCGHLPSYTHPEALAEVVRQFLTPPGQACPGTTRVLP